MKRCIFYLPYKMEQKAMGARMLRPRKMIQAFQDIGYDVFVIEGFSRERSGRIQEVKKRIAAGDKFDFMYTESHTVPTLLTDPHHLPLHPFLDFGFFKYVRRHGIPVGLFYCDIYWKFEIYGEGLPAWKKRMALINYAYDIKEYKRYLNRFYVPDTKVCGYLNEPTLTQIASELPPGADPIESVSVDYSGRDFAKDGLRLFYVGGLGSQYQISELLKAVGMVEGCQLTLCCRESDWMKEKENLSSMLNDRIQVIHKTSNELKPYYQNTDICSLMFEKDVYREMAKPFKAFEYLANEIPVLSTSGTAIGRFVEENDIGWSIPYKAEEIAGILRAVIANPMVLQEKRKHCHTTKIANLWTVRARQVASDLA